MRINRAKLGTGFEGAGDMNARGMNHIIFSFGDKKLKRIDPPRTDVICLVFPPSLSTSLLLPALSLGEALGQHPPGNLSKSKNCLFILHRRGPEISWGRSSL